MKRIDSVWDKIAEAADGRVSELLRTESYELHPLKRMTTRDRKERVIDYAGEEDKPLLKAVHEVIAPLLARKISPVCYSSIRNRGQTACHKRVRRLVRRFKNGYFLLVDIRKYYQHIDHGMLKAVIRRHFKDKRLIRFLDKLIDHHKEGLPIGLSLSSYLANLYLDGMMRTVTEKMGVDAVGYMDDLLFFFDTKEEAKAFLVELERMVSALKLEMHKGVRISPVARGVPFIGYTTYPTHTRLRKNIRERMKKRHRELEKMGADDEEYKRKMASYFGWCIHADCIHLLRKTMGHRYRLFEENVMEYKKLRDKKAERNWFGLPKEARESIRDLVGKELVVFESQEVEVYRERKAAVRYCYPDREEEMHYFLTRSEVVMDRLEKDRGEWPAVVTIIEKTGENKRKYFCYE